MVTLTNHEYVRYADVEIDLPLTADGETTPLFINPVNDTEPVQGTLSSTNLEPNGGTINAYFRVDINSGADSGVFEFHLVFRAMNDYTKQQVTGVIPVIIRVYPKDPILIIPQIETDNKGRADVEFSVEPGKSFTLTFTLRNLGGDDARDVYITISNDWYANDPFTTIDAYITSISTHTTSYYDSGNLQNLSRVAQTDLSDLGIHSTSDIVDAERQLLAPTAIVPRIYIPIIRAGEEHEVNIRMKADTHMIKGRPYREYILIEYIDSDGLQYRYDENNPSLSTKPFPITIYTKESDDWPGDDELFESATLAIFLFIVIVIILVLIILGSIFQKRREEEPGEREYKYKDEDEFPEDEDLEEEMPEEEEPDELDELEDEEEEEEKEPDWNEDEDEDLEDEDEEEEDEEDDDWAISEEESTEEKPGKGKAPAKGKPPVIRGKGKDSDEDDDLEDW
jgi:hypothetical protein